MGLAYILLVFKTRYPKGQLFCYICYIVNVYLYCSHVRGRTTFMSYLHRALVGDGHRQQLSHAVLQQHAGLSFESFNIVRSSRPLCSRNRSRPLVALIVNEESSIYGPTGPRLRDRRLGPFLISPSFMICYAI